MTVQITACWVDYPQLRAAYYITLIVAQVFTLMVVLSGVYFYSSFLKLKKESLKLQNKSMCRSFGLILVWQICLIILTIVLCLFDGIFYVLMWIDVVPKG